MRKTFFIILMICFLSTLSATSLLSALSVNTEESNLAIGITLPVEETHISEKSFYISESSTSFGIKVDSTDLLKRINNRLLLGLNENLDILFIRNGKTITIIRNSADVSSSSNDYDLFSEWVVGLGGVLAVNITDTIANYATVGLFFSIGGWTASNTRVHHLSNGIYFQDAVKFRIKNGYSFEAGINYRSSLSESVSSDGNHTDYSQYNSFSVESVNPFIAFCLSF